MSDMLNILKQYNEELHYHELSLDINDNTFCILREDLLPFSFGGNKFRIGMEHVLEAMNRNADVVVSYGSPSSNMNRVIASLCSALGIECQIITFKANDNVTNNMIISRACNAEIIEISSDDIRGSIGRVLEDITKNGKTYYYIYGDETGQGNETVSLRAYQKIGNNLLDIGLGNYDYIFHASGTGVTQAGLMLSKIDSKIIGISVARTKKIAETYFNTYFERAIENRMTNKSQNDLMQEWMFIDDYLEGKYGEYVEPFWDSLKNFGIPMDSTYVAKGFKGMMQYIKKHNIKNKKIMFIHTGGTPIMFDEIGEGRK